MGNTYGAYLGNQRRKVPAGYRESYAATGDPNGLEPILQTIASFDDENQTLLPDIASNDISAFRSVN